MPSLPLPHTSVAGRTHTLRHAFWAAPRFPDSGIGAISCCALPVQVLVVDFLRSSVAESRMETSAIIPELNIPRNVLPRFSDRRIHGTVNPLDFYGSIERFGESIVKARPCATDRLADSQLRQHGGELGGRVIAAAIAVEYGTIWQIDVTGGHLDRAGDQRRPVIIIYRPSDYLTRRAVNDRRQKRPALPGGDVRNIADHLRAGDLGGEVAVHQVRDRAGLALLRGGRPPRPRLAGHQAELPHQPADQLGPGDDALPGHLPRDAPVPVGAA